MIMVISLFATSSDAPLDRKGIEPLLMNRLGLCVSLSYTKE